MSPVVIKGLAVVGATVAVSLGAWEIYSLIHGESMPEFVAIKTPTSNKFGADFQPYLVDKDDTKNKNWWEWSYSSKFSPKKTDLSTEFNSVDSVDKLKETCGIAYGKDTSTELTATSSSDNKAKYGRDTWRFCSIFKEKPRTIEDNSGDGKSDKANLGDNGAYKDKFGSSKKAELVSVTDTGKDNEVFWRVREKEFFGKENENGIGHHSKSEENQKTIFDKLYDTKKGSRGSLKKTCAEAYKKTNGTSPNPTENEVVKFCGLKKQN